MTAGTNTPKVAICAIVRDEATYIEEWVDFHRLQGVTEWRIYDNGSVDGTPDVLRALRIDPAIWAGRAEHYADQQLLAYAEGATILSGTADWVMFIDVDEFVFAADHGGIPAALARLPESVGAVAIQQRVFGSSRLKTRELGPVTGRFTRCAAWSHPESRWFKTIAKPRQIDRFDSAHSVVLASGDYVFSDGSPLTRDSPHPGEASRVVEGTLRLHHYVLKSFEEFQAKQAKWADRAMGGKYDDPYFFVRDAYANEVECLDLVPGRRPRGGVRVAAVTMVYNEPDFLPLWLRHYARQVGQENCFVIDDGSDDGSTEIPGLVNRIRLPKSDFDEYKRSALISWLCAALTQHFDYVLFTDVDEFVVPDPDVAASLMEYCGVPRRPVTTAIGVNIVHRVGREADLDPGAPLLRQRAVAFPLASMFKPVLIQRPVKWAIGQHSYDGPVELDGLYLFHIAYADLALTLRRQAKRRMAVASHPYKPHNHRSSDLDVTTWIENWSRMPLGGQDDLDSFARAVLASQAGREQAEFRVDLNLWGDRLWTIPERFRDAF